MMENVAVKILASLGLFSVAVIIAIAFGRCIFAALDTALAKWRRLGFAARVVSAAMVVIATVEAQKGGGRSGGAESGGVKEFQLTHPPTPNSPTVPLFTLSSVVTNDVFSYSMPSNAVRYPNWWMRGAYEDVFKLDFGDWYFPLGTASVSSLWIYTWGKARSRLRGGYELSAVVSPMSAVPQVSEFWYSTGTNGTKILTWHNFFLGRIHATSNIQTLEHSNIPTLLSAQLELFPNGDFIARSNLVERSYKRVNPDDWDDDGIPNDVDDDPFFYDGDNFGSSAELPDGADSNNYCWVEVVVSNANSLVTFTGDGASNLPDPNFIARAGATNRVNLLIGKTYRVVSAQPIFCTAKSSEEIEVSGDGDRTMTVVWPVSYEITENARSASRQVRMIPPCLVGTFDWNTNTCCEQIQGSPSELPRCSPDCTCGGCTLGGFTFDYEGYSLYFDGIDCGCTYGSNEELTPSLSLSAAPAVVLKDKGLQTFGRSYLTCRIAVDRPGTFTLTQTGDQCTVHDLNDMQCFDGYTWTVESPQTCEYIFVVNRTEKSSSLEGTVFNVNFTAEDGSVVMDSSARVVFSEYETQTVATWPIDRSRRMIGVCEKVHVVFNPQPLGMKLSVSSSGGGIENTGNGRWTYTAPDHACEDVVNSSLCGSLFCLSVVEPVGYESRLHSIEYDERTGVSGSFRVCMDLVLMPTNVSFSAIDVIEIGERASRFSGYFSELRNAHHLEHSTAAGANVWVSVGMGNKCCDYVTMAELLPPWIGGGLLWPIPNKYRRSGSADAGRFFCNTDQRFSVDFLGTSSCDKFGWHVSVTTNRNVTFSKGTNQ